MKNRYFVLTLFFLYALGSFYFLDKYPLFFADEAYYAEPGYNFMNEGRFRNDLFRHFPGFEETNIIMGRIFSAADALAFKVLGVTVVAVRIQSFLLGLLSLMLTYLIAKDIFGNRTVAFVSAGFLAFSHLFVFASHFGRPDMAISFFILLTIYFYVRAEKKNSLPLYFLAGLTAPLAADTHLSGAVASYLLLALCIRTAFSKPFPWKTLLSIGAGFICGLSWWVLMHVIVNWNVFFRQYAFLKAIVPAVFHPLQMLQDELFRWHSFFWLGAYHRNMFLLGLFLLSFLYAFRGWREYGNRILLTSIAGVMAGFILIAPQKVTWYIIYIYPLFIILTSHFLCGFLGSPVPWEKYAAMVLVSCSVLFLSLENYHKLRFIHSNYYSFMDKIKKQIPAHSGVFASETYWLGLKGHAPLLGMWISTMKSHMDAIGFPVEGLSGTFEEFFRREKVQYLIADEEALSFPVTQHFLLPFIAKNCRLVGEVSDPFYGTSLYMAKRSTQPLITKIYKVER